MPTRRRSRATRSGSLIRSAAAAVALAVTAFAAGCADTPSEPPPAAPAPADAPAPAPAPTSKAREFQLRDARAAASVEELERRRGDVEALVRDAREVAELNELSVSPDTGTITVDVTSTLAGRTEPREDIAYRLAFTLATEIWTSLDERLDPATVPPSLAVRVDEQRFRCDGATMLAFARQQAGPDAFARQC